MKIGELANATATKVETVRFYERIGLLSPPARTSANYRAYGNEHLAALVTLDLRLKLYANCSHCLMIGRSHAKRWIA
jgi:DNA-binding transcriptional MerR regulator